MAYTTLKSGSRGEEVKKLQNLLIGEGYDVGSAGADGIYGANTAAAVKKYQTDNGLMIDGIAGNQTWTSLDQKAAARQQAAAEQAAQSAPVVENESPIKGVTQEIYNQMAQPYTPDQKVTEAWATIEQLQQKLNGGTKYEEQLDTLVQDILSRPAFQYNVEEDALFQQMLESSKKSGEKAMEDTIARSSALTGGYGNSWAQTAGQQTYDQYLQDAYAQFPQYYQLALNAHQMESDELAKKYSLLSAEDQKEFDRLMSEIGLATNAYDRLYAQDLAQHGDNTALAQQLAAMMSSDYWNQQTADFQKEQFEYQKEQDAIANSLASAKASSGGSGGGSSESEVDAELNDLMDSYNNGISDASKKGDEALAKYLLQIKGKLDQASYLALLDENGIASDFAETFIPSKVIEAFQKLMGSDDFANMTARQQQVKLKNSANAYSNEFYYDALKKYLGL